ncbi:MAG: preprotein translocase subunit SecG [Bacteroidota bacterium]|nr:preprotein translocase subunit SecG [Bacteroidota bacterium]
MFTVLMILIILIGALMTVVILMQSSKGQGLSGAFGGAGGVGTMLGVRRAADVLAKATWVLATAFIFLIFLINLFFLPTEGTEESIINRQMQEQPLRTSPQQTAPQQAPTQEPAPQPQGGGQ